MTDEARRLLGGYATRTLSDAERKQLLEAALHNDELFAALVDEQVLQDLLDDPIAKDRLLASLAPRPKRALRWAVPVALAAMLTIGVALSFLWVRRYQPQEIAQSREVYSQPREPLQAPEVEAPKDEPRQRPSAKPKPKRQVATDAQAKKSDQVAAPPPSAPAADERLATQPEKVEAVLKVQEPESKMRYAFSRPDGQLLLTITPEESGSLVVADRDKILVTTQVHSGQPVKIGIAQDAREIVATLRPQSTMNFAARMKESRQADAESTRQARGSAGPAPQPFYSIRIPVPR